MKPELDTLATAQHGLLTWAQLRSALGERGARTWVLSGRMAPLRRGVYRAFGTAASWPQSLHAVTLATGAVASHRAAGRVWDLPVPCGDSRLEVTVPLGRQARLAGVTYHRSNLLLADFVTQRDGIPVTTAARTVADLTAVLGAPTCARALDAADRLDVASYADVDVCYRRMRRRGRRRMTVLERLLEARLDGTESADSDWEIRLVRWLVAAGLGAPVQQHWVVAGAERFCLDLAYPAARLAVEFDGWSTHRQRGRYDSDRRRWRLLTLAGWTVLPYTSACLRSEVVADVSAALAAARRRAA